MSKSTFISKSRLLVVLSIVICQFALSSTIAIGKPISNKPPMPYYDWGECVVLCAEIGSEWVAGEAIIVYRDRDIKSPIAFTLKANEHVKLLDRVIVTIKPSIEKVIKFPNDCNLKIGKTIYGLTYLGEGERKYWDHGVVKICSLVNEDSVSVISESVEISWIKVKNSIGLVGWTPKRWAFDDGMY